MKPGQAFVQWFEGWHRLLRPECYDRAWSLPTSAPWLPPSVARTGLALSIPDVGVSLHFPISFALPAAAFMIPLGILVNVVMLLLKLTKTVDIDVWNFWPWMFSWACVQGIDRQRFLRFFGFRFHRRGFPGFGRLAGKNTSRSITTCRGFPSRTPSRLSLVCWPGHSCGFLTAFPASRIGMLTSNPCKKKIGPLGNSTVFGLVIGIALSLVAGYDMIKALQTVCDRGCHHAVDA